MYRRTARTLEFYFLNYYSGVLLKRGRRSCKKTTEWIVTVPCLATLWSSWIWLAAYKHLDQSQPSIYLISIFGHAPRWVLGLTPLPLLSTVGQG